MNYHNKERMEESCDESELSDDEFEEESSFDDLLDRLVSNDPSLTKLEVRLSRLVEINDDGYLALNDDRLYRMSVAIGRNAHLNALMCDGYGVQFVEAQAMILFHGIACNQSIKRIHFRHCGECFHSGNAGRILAPLFKNNQVERIRIYNCYLSLEGIGLLETSLTEFDSLKEFALTNNTIRDYPDSQQAARDLVQSLSGHSRLRKIELSSTNVGKLGCSALADELLSNPSIKLRVLDLTMNNLGDAEAVVLASGIARNVSLKEINLAWNRDIYQAGWQALFDAISTPSCSLEKLALDNNEINDAAAQSLSNSLASSTTLKTLNLGCNRSITLARWRVLFDFLRSQTCALEDLDLGNNELISEVMVSLTGALAGNMTLKSLNLSSNCGVTGGGWQRFFSTVLANPSSGLEKLVLVNCGINNAKIRALTNALVNNSKLEVLDLSDNNLITNAGWEMFSSVLESTHTALEELVTDTGWIDLDTPNDLQGNELDNDTATLLVNSLAGNKKLKKLIFDNSEEWEPPQSVLCNAASIMDTFTSNHTLQKVGLEDEILEDNFLLPEEFESLLQINRENSPSQAARLKIIKTHFKDGFITQPFVGMDLNVLPRAMAWMGRDGRAGEVDGHYFSFIKSISSLFENVN